MTAILILAIVIFLIIERPIAFICIFIPLGLAFIVAIANLISGKRGHLGNLATVYSIFTAIIIALLLVI